MKRLINLIAAGAVAISLAACATDGIPILTKPIANPITTTTLYQAELAFDAGVKTFNTLKDLCAQRVLKPSCRTYVIRGQKAIRIAHKADLEARDWVAKNPTLDASGVISAFSRAVDVVQSEVGGLESTKQ